MQRKGGSHLGVYPNKAACQDDHSIVIPADEATAARGPLGGPAFAPADDDIAQPTA